MSAARSICFLICLATLLSSPAQAFGQDYDNSGRVNSSDSPLFTFAFGTVAPSFSDFLISAAVFGLSRPTNPSVW